MKPKGALDADTPRPAHTAVKTSKPPTAPKDVREARQAAALKANLKRRKAAAAKAKGVPWPLRAELAPKPCWQLRQLVAYDRENGNVHPVTIEISSPFDFEDQDAGCTVKIVGVSAYGGGNHEVVICGVDKFQALELALFHAEDALELLATTHDVGWPGEGDESFKEAGRYERGLYRPPNGYAPKSKDGG